MSISLYRPRIQSRELMKVIEDASVKLYEKDKGSLNIDFYIERDVFGVSSIFPRSHTPLYHLSVTFKSGVFGLSETRFEFVEASEDDIYRVAIASIKAWSDEYFKDKEKV